MRGFCGIPTRSARQIGGRGNSWAGRTRDCSSIGISEQRMDGVVRDVVGKEQT